MVVAKLHKRYHVDLTLHPPKVPYRETIRGKADAEGKHKKQTGGHGQFGVCRVRLEPAARGTGIEFVDDIFGGAIPKNWIPSVEKGIRASAERGYLAGFPVVDFRAILYDGKYHDVDSSDMAFKIAGSLAFKEGMKQARPALLEPVMHVEVYAPDQYSGDIMGDLSSRRGRISGSEARGSSVIVKAQVPFAEMLNYATTLTSMTQGRATYSMEYSHYDYVPGRNRGESDRRGQGGEGSRSGGGRAGLARMRLKPGNANLSIGVWHEPFQENGGAGTKLAVAHSSSYERIFASCQRNFLPDGPTLLSPFIAVNRSTGGTPRSPRRLFAPRISLSPARRK